MLSKLIGGNNYLDARKLFKRQYGISASVHVFAACIVMLGYMMLLRNGYSIVDRLPDFITLIAICMLSIINQTIFSLAVFMRAHGNDPLVLPSLLTGIATLTLIACASLLSVALMMLLNTAIQLFICLPWVFTLFYWRYWRQPSNRT